MSRATPQLIAAKRTFCLARTIFPPYWLNGALLPAVRSTAGKCRADSREENDGLPVVSSKPASQRLAVCLLLVGSLLTESQ